MKREQFILQAMSDVQLNHAQKLLDREVKRRSSPPPAANPQPRKSGQSGQHRRVTEEQTSNRRKTG